MLPTLQPFPRRRSFRLLQSQAKIKTDSATFLKRAQNMSTAELSQLIFTLAAFLQKREENSDEEDQNWGL